MGLFFFNICSFRQGVAPFYNSKNVLWRALCLGHVSISEQITVAGEEDNTVLWWTRPGAGIQAVVAGSQWPSPQSHEVSLMKEIMLPQEWERMLGRKKSCMIRVKASFLRKFSTDVPTIHSILNRSIIKIVFLKIYYFMTTEFITMYFLNTLISIFLNIFCTKPTELYSLLFTMII